MKRDTSLFYQIKRNNLTSYRQRFPGLKEGGGGGSRTSPGPVSQQQLSVPATVNQNNPSLGLGDWILAVVSPGTV